MESINTPDSQFEFYANNKFKNSIDYGNNLTTNGSSEEKYQLSKIINEDQQETTTIVHGFPLAEPDAFGYKPSNIDGYTSDYDYYSTNHLILSNVAATEDFKVKSAQQPDYTPKVSKQSVAKQRRSSPPGGYSSDYDYYSPNQFILSNVSAHEDFTVKSAQQPDYAPKLPKQAVAKQKMLENHDKRRSSPPSGAPRPTNLRKNSSVSTVDLHKIDEQFSSISTSSRKPVSRGSSPIRNSANSKIRKSESSNQVKNQNQKNLSVQFFTKPQRSKTAIDMKANSRSSIPRSVQSPVPLQQQMPPPQSIPHSMSFPIPGVNHMMMLPQSHEPASFSSFETSSEAHELQMISNGHDTLFNTLCNRITSLEMIRNQMR